MSHRGKQGILARRHRLLLLSCSRQKRRTRKLLPAIERYDGPAFRVLRRYLDQQPKGRPDVLILSAKWGLIAGDALLPPYERRMTSRRASEIQEDTTARLRKFLALRPCEVFMSMSEIYFQAINVRELSQINSTEIFVVQGGRGRNLSALYDWLHGAPPPKPKTVRRPSSKGQRGNLRLRGVEIECDKSRALALARQALPQEAAVATRINSWYVQLGRGRVSPKWLVSKIFGLPVNSFVTDEARRVLAQLGVEVRRSSL